MVLEEDVVCDKCGKDIGKLGDPDIIYKACYIGSEKFRCVDCLCGDNNDKM